MPQTILITGASKGIGLACAQRLHSQGHRVWGTARDIKTCSDLLPIHWMNLDLLSESSIDELARLVESKGGVDVLVNNAGFSPYGSIEQMDSQTEQDLFQALVFGPRRLLAKLLPLMKKNKSGVIINISSLASRLPIPFMGAYSAAKAAMTIYTRALQMELRGSGILVHDLQPGDIATDFHRHMSKVPCDDFYSTKMAKTWAVIEKNMRDAPPAAVVARSVERLMSRRSQRCEVVGDFFQSKIATLAHRLLPTRWLDIIQEYYYRIR